MKRSFVLATLVISCALLFGLIYFQVQFINRTKERVDNQFDVIVKKATYEIGFKYEQNENAKIGNTIPDLDSLNRSGEFSLQDLIDSSNGSEYTLDTDLLDSLTQTVFSEVNLEGPFYFGVSTMEDELIYANTENIHLLEDYASTFQFSQGGFVSKPFIYRIYILSSDQYIKGALIQEIWWSFLVIGLIILSLLLALFFIVKQNRLSILKSEFIASMTHEIKTPLATLDLAIDTLNHPEFHKNQDQVRLFTEVLKTEIKRLNQHLHKIMEASLLQEREFNLSMQTVDCVPLLKEIVKAADLQVAKKGGSISVFGFTTEIYIHVDPIHFKHVVYNLIDNAIKYGGKTPEINVELGVDENLEIRISDKGPGIAKKYRKRVFSKLYRISRLTGPTEGAGLGLYYVKKMMNWMNGQVKFTANKPVGSCFILTFPLMKDGQVR